MGSDGAYSGSSSSTSGIGPVYQGGNTAGGGLKLPPWTPLVLIGGAVMVAVVAMVFAIKR